MSPNAARYADVVHELLKQLTARNKMLRYNTFAYSQRRNTTHHQCFYSEFQFRPVKSAATDLLCSRSLVH